MNHRKIVLDPHSHENFHAAFPHLLSWSKDYHGKLEEIIQAFTFLPFKVQA